MGFGVESRQGAEKGDTSQLLTKSGGEVRGTRAKRHIARHRRAGVTRSAVLPALRCRCGPVDSGRAGRTAWARGIAPERGARSEKRSEKGGGVWGLGKHWQPKCKAQAFGKLRKSTFYHNPQTPTPFPEPPRRSRPGAGSLRSAPAYFVFLWVCLGPFLDAQTLISNGPVWLRQVSTTAFCASF